MKIDIYRMRTLPIETIELGILWCCSIVGCMEGNHVENPTCPQLPERQTALLDMIER